jgi:hypothetical protein
VEPQYIDNYTHYNANITSSWAWLLSLVESLLLSILLWQPLTVYVVTWIKLWQFTWNIKMSIMPGNIKRCCSYVCGCTAAHTSEEDSHLGANAAIAAHKDRPLDTIAYFSNEDMFLHLAEDNEDNVEEKLDAIEEELGLASIDVEEEEEEEEGDHGATQSPLTPISPDPNTPDTPQQLEMQILTAAARKRISKKDDEEQKDNKTSGQAGDVGNTSPTSPNSESVNTPDSDAELINRDGSGGSAFSYTGKKNTNSNANDN